MDFWSDFETYLPSELYFVTVIMTSNPSNEAELQLYRVMQRASLLAYYDTLLEMGKGQYQWLYKKLKNNVWIVMIYEWPVFLHVKINGTQYCGL